MVALVGLSLLFSLTRGLAWSDGGEPQFTSSLQSSGGDDNISIAAGAGIFAVGLVLALLPSPGVLTWWLKSTPVAALWLVQVALVPPEVGSIGYTVFGTHNFVLAAWLIALAALPVTLVYGSALKLRSRREVP